MSDNAQTASAKSSKNKKPNVFVRMGRAIKRFFREIFSELKKVSWPGFKKVLTQTGVVITVVIIWLLVIFGFDTLMTFLLNLLRGLA